MFGNRGGDKPPPPSGGLVSRPIGGLGKLTPGRHALEVLSVVRHPHSVDVLLTAPTGEAHYERVADWPREWDSPGTKLQASIEPSSGAAMSRNGGRYQGVDARTRQPLTNWSDDPAQVLDWLHTRGHQAASTQLTEVANGERVFTVHLAETSKPGPVAPGGAAADPVQAGQRQPVDGTG